MEGLEVLYRRDEAALYRANVHLERLVRTRHIGPDQCGDAGRKPGVQSGGVRTDPVVRVRANPTSASEGPTARRASGERGAAQGGASSRQNGLQVVASLLDMLADTLENRSMRTWFEDS